MGIFDLFKKKINPEVICGGVVKDYYMDGYNNEIKSNNIVSFEYTCGDYNLKCSIEDNSLHVLSSGGYSNQRDGKYFKLDYTTSDMSILKEIDKIIKDNELSKGNGYVHETAGLPPGLGDTLDVIYDSDEKIYKTSNQCPNVNEDIAKLFYDLFHKSAKDNNLDFNSEGSNVQLYDDADEDYLQDTWTGTHFGDNIKVEFNKNNIKIYVNDELKDDCEYVICEGWVRLNKLKEGVEEAKDHYSYEEFESCSGIRKKNDILIVMYFSKPGYSTCELLRESVRK